MYFYINMYFSYNHKKLKDYYVNKKYASIIDECYFSPKYRR